MAVRMPAPGAAAHGGWGADGPSGGGRREVVGLPVAPLKKGFCKLGFSADGLEVAGFA